MPLMPLVEDAAAPQDVRAVFDDIRALRKSDYVNNIWRALANDPKQLAMTWGNVKAVMGPGALDPLTKEMIYLAVSAANNCEYCLHTHAHSAHAKGLTQAQFNELMQVVTLASETNRIAIGLQVPLDPRYADAPDWER